MHQVPHILYMTDCGSAGYTYYAFSMIENSHRPSLYGLLCGTYLLFQILLVNRELLRDLWSRLPPQDVLQLHVQLLLHIFMIYHGKQVAVSQV